MEQCIRHLQRILKKGPQTLVQFGCSSMLDRHTQQVQAAADNAMLKGLTRIQEAAVAAVKPIKDELNKVSVKDLEEMAKEELEGAEKNQTDSLKLMLEAEKTRQQHEMSDMEDGANMVAKLSSDHVRQTAEEYAKNQARNQIFHKAKGPMAEAIEKSEKTEAIRQEAVELTMGTIKSAANSLGVAKKAQAAIAMVPKDAMSNAIATSKKSKKEQKVLNTEIKSVAASVRHMAQMAEDGYAMALRTLDEAKASEVMARKALETSRGNALKIERLKTRAAEVGARAKAASQN